MVSWQQGGLNPQVLRWVLLPPPGRRKIPAVKMGLRRSPRASQVQECTQPGLEGWLLPFLLLGEIFTAISHVKKLIKA